MTNIHIVNFNLK